MTPTEKKLALIQHITALEADALAEVYQTLLPETKEEAHSENDVKSYVLRVEVPAADWVFFELLLARMQWEFEILHTSRPSRSLSEIFSGVENETWTEKEERELIENNL